MIRFLQSKMIPNPAVGYEVANAFEMQLKRGLVPIKTLKIGTPIDRTVSLATAKSIFLSSSQGASKKHSDAQLLQLLTCSPTGNTTDSNRFSGVNLDSTPGNFAYYGGLVVPGFNASPGMVAEMRHYAQEQITKAPIIQPGEFSASSVVGQRNPTFAFSGKIVVRARLNREIDVIDFDRHNPQVQSFDRSFSNQVLSELQSIKQQRFIEALMLDANYSVARAVGNLVLDSFEGLQVSSARDATIETGLWKGQETNIVLGAMPHIPIQCLTAPSLYTFDFSGARPLIKSLRNDAASDFLSHAPG